LIAWMAGGLSRDSYFPSRRACRQTMR